MSVPCCGPKCSVCCAAFSAWGILMLVLLGIFFHIESVVLVEDLPIDPRHWALQGYPWSYAQEKYKTNAISCWVAAAVYLFFFLFSCVMFKVNQLPRFNQTKPAHHDPQGPMHA